MVKTYKKIKTLLFLSLFMIQILAFNNLNNPIKQNGGNLSLDEEEMNFNDNFDNNLQNKVVGQDPPGNYATPPSTWWNETYQFRIRVEINNTKSFSRNLPIEIDSSFIDGNAYNNTLRIVKFTDEIIEEWTQIPCQVIDPEYSGDFYLTATILFVENSLLPGTNVYYIYYNSEDVIDDTDYDDILLTTNLVGDNLNVQWNDSKGNGYEIEMDVNSGMNHLEFINDGNNLHTDNSTAPGLLDIERDLIGYWSFEDDAIEQTGHCPQFEPPGYTDYGDVNYGPAVYGNGRIFDGTDDYIAIDADETLYGGLLSTNGFTVMSWFNTTSQPGSGDAETERILASWDRSAYWRFSIRDDDTLWWATNVNDTMHDMTINVSSYTITDGNFHHYAATYDPITGSKYVYLDGDLVGTAAGVHPAGTTLGQDNTDEVSRFGNIGSGSEAVSYKGTPNPTNQFNGTLDEMRFYNRTLDLAEINIAKNKNPYSDIYSIQEIINGPVMSQYTIIWNSILYEESNYMDIVDKLTFYRSMNAWKVTRTFEWDGEIIALDNSDFAAYNTFFSWETDDINPTYTDLYYYDNQTHEGHENVDFTAENYTVLYDYDGSHSVNNVLGLYLTDYDVGPTGSLSEIGWEIDILSTVDDNEIINFIPGNYTNLYLPDLSTLTMEFWEYVEYGYTEGSSNFDNPDTGRNKFENYYQSLITPLEIEVDDDNEESLFFIVKVNVYDIDGNNVPYVNASLIASNGSVIASGLTDSDGNITFIDVDEDNYILNLTYSKYGEANTLELGEYAFTLDNDNTSYQNTRVLSEEVKMTSIELHFKSFPDETDIVGAEILFNTSNTAEYIGSEITDIDGNVTFHWSNFSSAVDLLEISCNFYNDTREIQNATSAFGPSIFESFESHSYVDVSVSVDNFETIMNQTNLAPDITWGENLIYNFSYYYSVEVGEWHPIEDATVSYEIKAANSMIHQGVFDSTNENGSSYNELDYNASGINLIGGKEYTFVVTVSKDGYTPFTNISNIYINKINTTITADVGNVESVEWGDEFTLSIFYNDTFYGVPINNTNTIVSYQSVLYPQVNGLLVADSGLGEGWFTATINTTEDIITGPGNYTLRITAQNENYQTQSIDHQLSISPILTSLQADPEIINVYWEYNFTISVQYNDTSDGPINDASVTWKLVTNPTVNGILSRDAGKGEGWYSVDINSSFFINTGVYTLEITASSQNYDTIEKIIPLNIMNARTKIRVNDEEPVSDLLRMSVSIYETDNFSINVYYIKTDTSAYIAGTTSRLFTWSLSNDPSVFGTGDVNIVDDHYSVDFDTTSLEAGDYILLITLGQLNYEQKQAMILLTVEKRVFNYEYKEDLSKSISKVSGNELKFSISLKDLSTGIPITNATIIISFDNSTLDDIILTDLDSDGIYTSNKTFTKDEVNAFFRDRTFITTLKISKEHYATVEETISITIKMAEIANGFPTFYFLLIIGAVVIISATIGGYKYVQYAKIPGFVKLLDKVQKDITNDKEVSKENITLTVNQEISEKFGDIWEILDLDLAHILESGTVSKNDNITSNDNMGGDN